MVILFHHELLTNKQWLQVIDQNNNVSVNWLDIYDLILDSQFQNQQVEIAC